MFTVKYSLFEAKKGPPEAQDPDMVMTPCATVLYIRHVTDVSH